MSHEGTVWQSSWERRATIGFGQCGDDFPLHASSKWPDTDPMVEAPYGCTMYAMVSCADGAYSL